MGRPRKEELRELKEEERQELKRVVKATSERIDAIKRAKALLAVAAGATLTVAGQEAGLSREAVAQMVKRFNQRGLTVLEIAAGRGRKPMYTSEQRARVLAEVQREPDREKDQTATWSLMLLRDGLRKTGLPHIAAETIRLIELACEQAEAAGIMQLNEDEAGPYQAIPQPGASWQLQGHPATQPHEYERGGTAKLLTLFRPATGEIRAKGVLSAPNAVLHPWLIEQLTEVLAEIEKAHPRAELPPEDERPVCARWETWLGHPPRNPEPPLRIVLVLDNLAGHLSYDLVRWFFDHGVMPLYTPVGGSWLNMAESVQRIIVRRALSGQHPKDAQQVIEWLEQTVAGWNADPTPFVWNGKRRRRRERARLRRLAGSGAAMRICKPIAS